MDSKELYYFFFCSFIIFKGHLLNMEKNIEIQILKAKMLILLIKDWFKSHLILIVCHFYIFDPIHNSKINFIT